MSALRNKVMGLRAVLGVVAAAMWAILPLAGCESAAALSEPGVEPTKPVPVADGPVRAPVQAVGADGSPTATPGVNDQAHFGEDVPLPSEALPSAGVSEEVAGATAPPPDGGDSQGEVAGRFWNDVPGSTSGESGGLFRGRWVSADQSRRGVVRGEYEPSPPGELPEGVPAGGIFHGKFVERRGQLEGFVRGRYGLPPDGQGFFRGRWFGREYFVLGVLKGRWIEEPGADGGKFAGGWASSNVCEEARSLPDIRFAKDDFAALEAEDDVLAPDEALEVASPIPAETIVPQGDRPPPCVNPDFPFGFLGGRHVPDRAEGDAVPPPAGQLHGRWVDADGELLGMLVGRYKMLPPPGSDDLPTLPLDLRLGIFHARFIDTSGTFRGSVRGVFGMGDLGIGVFRGHYFDTDHQELGFVLGRWDEDLFRPGGPFGGVWNGQPLVDEGTDVAK